MDADGNNVVQLTTDPDYESSAAWSPDGAQIAFNLYDLVDSDIYLMDADGGNVVQITNNAVDDFSPNWQPVPGGSPATTSTTSTTSATGSSTPAASPAVATRATPSFTG
jgi:TolB protein